MVSFGFPGIIWSRRSVPSPGLFPAPVPWTHGKVHRTRPGCEFRPTALFASASPLKREVKP